MADLVQLRMLKQGRQAWIAWREENPSTKVDLRQADLRGADLSVLDLHGADFSGAHLNNADIEGSLLINAFFRE
ncbi:MAG TPA: pentapeptide repeat-containing protein, partial [Ktedonobacteraceae bacterium]|nr:pentapeptide repeat-containing protein [Ktedonobacteraceae bacterium]